MDSINKNQPEDNHKDVSNAEAAKKIKQLVDKNPGCFFCTAISTGESQAARPMSVLKTDDNGTLWFMSANDSHKNKEILLDSKVHLYFQGSSHSDFMHLSGEASISEDKAKIKELWNPMLKVWFTEGENDPRISVIKVVPDIGYYWDTKHGKAVAGIKMMLGAMIGKTLDDSVEGTILV
ncbi:MAG: pyridoxamine 5'-phosphate oxidase family protein [Bacteroidota bacterium]